MKGALAAILLALSQVPAIAGLVTGDLDRVFAAPAADATLPLAQVFRDERDRERTLGEALDSKPTLLIFTDYTCHTLCGPIVTMAADALAQSGLKPEEFRLVAIGIDWRDSVAAARALKSSRLADNAVADSAVFLTGSQAAIEATARAAAYQYAYDGEHDQFAHPAAAYVVNPDGRITQVLSALAMGGADVRLALVGAGDGRIGTFADRIRLLCYGYDPVRGIYTERITFLLQAAAVGTLAFIVGGIVLMELRARGRAAP